MWNHQQGFSVSPSQQRKVLCFFVAVLSSGLGLEAAELVLRSPVPAVDGYVLLGDVAEIRSADAATAAQLQKIKLVPAPAAGSRRILRAREIQELLFLQGVEINTLKFTGANRVEVVAADPAAADTGTPSEKQEYVVAVRPLKNGDIIRRDDVIIKEFPSLPKGLTAPLQNLDKSIGYEVARSIAAGQVLDAAYLRRPILVQRNRIVRLVARVGGIQVVTQGRALADGAADDIVSLEMLDDRTKLVTGRVTGVDEVEVFASGAALSPVARAAPLPNSK